MKNIILLIIRVFIFSIAMFAICGLAYPLALTGVSQLIFPYKANGSLIYIDGKAVGSELIGQTFDDHKFMQGRPSAVNYNVYTKEEKENGDYAGVSSGSKNYAPSNPALAERVKSDLEKFVRNNPTVKIAEVPTDLMTASGSGLDPHISPAAAAIQIPRISQSTEISENKIIEIVHANTSGKTFGILGEPTVNVLKVNLEIYKELQK